MTDIVEWLRNSNSDEWCSGQLLKAADEIERLRERLAEADDIRIDYICKINKLVDEREKLKKALKAILNDVGYHNPMRMTTEISDKILEDAAGALNDKDL